MSVLRSICHATHFFFFRSLSIFVLVFISILIIFLSLFHQTHTMECNADDTIQYENFTLIRFLLTSTAPYIFLTMVIYKFLCCHFLIHMKCFLYYLLLLSEYLLGVPIYVYLHLDIKIHKILDSLQHKWKSTQTFAILKFINLFTFMSVLSFYS